MFKRHPELEKLVLHGNPINIIHINDIEEEFPKLRIIQAGSEKTHYLSPPILDAITKKKDPLRVVIVDEFGKFMRTPPIHILNGGSKSIKIFQKAKHAKTCESKFDMFKNTTKNFLMLLGQPMAGKTSLLSTLRRDETVFTSAYERTVLLERSNLVLKEDTIISTYDFGAQNIYEIEYPMFLRSQNIIVLIVIDFSVYEPADHDKLVTRWLINCVLCAECKVIFVPSKSEMLDPDEIKFKFQKLKEQITMYITDEIQLLNDEKEKLQNLRPGKGEEDLRKIDKSLRFFNALINDISIIITSAYKQEGLEELKKEILSKIDRTEDIEDCEMHVQTMNYILEKGKEQHYFVSFDEIEKYFNEAKINKGTEIKKGRLINFKGFSFSSKKTLTAKDKLKICLDDCRRKGWILWYNECEKYIFTNVDNILSLHRKLYRHDLKSVFDYNVWEFNNIINNQIMFDTYKNSLLTSGLMNTHLLKCLWKKFKLSDDEFDSMIQLLIANDHCFVDPYCVTDSPVYRFPWFVSEKEDFDFWKKNWPEQLPAQIVEFNLKYTFLRRIPASLYERISVRLHNVHRDKLSFDRKDWKDGVYMGMGELKLLVQKQSCSQNQELCVKFRAPCESIIELWEWCRRIYNYVLKALIEVDTIVTYSKVFVCPHCIMNDRSLEESSCYPLGVIMESSYDNKTTNELCGTEPISAAYLNPPIPGRLVKIFIT